MNLTLSNLSQMGWIAGVLGQLVAAARPIRVGVSNVRLPPGTQAHPWREGMSAKCQWRTFRLPVRALVDGCPGPIEDSDIGFDQILS